MRARLVALLLPLALLAACEGTEAPDLSGGDPGPGDVAADAGRDAPADLPGDGRPEVAPDADDPGGDPAADPGPADPGPADPGDDPGTDTPPADPGDDPGTDPGPTDVLPGTPILDRAPDPRFDCAVARTTTGHEGRTWNLGTPALAVPSGGGAVLARAESQPVDPWSGAPAFLRLSTLAKDGTLGPSVDVASGAESVNGVAVAPRGDGLLLAWSDGTTLHTAVRGADLKSVSGPRTLAGTAADWGTRPRLAPLGDAFGLAWGEPVGETGRKVRFAVLDADGALVGTPLSFAVAGAFYEDAAPRPAAGTDRWGLLWRETESNRGHVYFAAVAPDGTLAVPRTRVSTTDLDGVTVGNGNWGQMAVALAPAGDGWLAAWPETRPGPQGMDGTTTVIRVARLDRDGRSLAEAPVRAPVADVAETEPLLVPFQGAVALLWTTGEHIYICGGCYPDNRLDFVLLDPDRLVPISDVRSLPNGPGGVKDVAAAVDGDDLPLAYLLAYHVSQSPASGWLTCSKR